MNDEARTKPGPGRCGYAALLCAALVASCHAPPSAGIYLHREKYGAIILHLSGATSGPVEGDVALTRLGVDGGVHVLARKLTGLRDGDTVRLRDPGGARVEIVLSVAGARVTLPDGETTFLGRTNAAGESALLADVAGQAGRLRADASKPSSPGSATRPSPIVR